MFYLNALIFGIVQALTEFLPVSSSGHLVLLHDILNFDIEQNLAFDIALHLGTATSLMIFFRSELLRLLKTAVCAVKDKKKCVPAELNLLLNLLYAAIPAGIIGVLFQDFIEERLHSPFVVVITLIIGALLFFAVERYSKRSRDLGGMNFRHAVLIGLAQALALIPGISRSGITITAAMALDFKRDEAARFSFLVSLPIILGAGAVKFFDLSAENLDTETIIAFAIGFVSSALLGFLVIKYLLRFLQNHSLAVFGWYRIALSIILLIWLLR